VSEVVVLSVTEVAHLAQKALVAHGARPESAASLAHAIAAAERDGISSHGLAYLPIYCEHLTCGKVDGSAVPTLRIASPSVVIVDAAAGFAHPAIDLGLGTLCPLAEKQGVAALAIYNSYNCGALGYHTERIAERKLVGLGFTNAPASIAPWGAVKPVLGTNPWSFAVPSAEAKPLFVIDQSASVVAKSEVMKRARAGQAIPPGWAFDASGRPTTDPQAALKGTMAPAGGYKGVGSALLVEVMAACLTGATPGAVASAFSGTQGGPPRTGQFFIAFAPGTTSEGRFFECLAIVQKSFVTQAGGRLPGSRRIAAREQADREGVRVQRDLHERICALFN